VVERLSNEPLPPALPVAHGSPRLGDGQGVPSERTPLKLATREVVIAVAFTVVFVVALLIGILR
jgi:hypothetical protein